MSQKTFTGAARDAAGRIQDTVGDFVDDAQIQARGKYSQGARARRRAPWATPPSLSATSR